MFKCKNKLFSVQKINELENCRVYNECEITPIQAFYSELGLYFNQCIENDLHIYVLNNKPIHKIELSSEDINYISIEPYKHREEPFNYYFSENIKYIKENQYSDFKWLLCENELDFLINIPNLDENNKYYYNFIVGLKNTNKIDDIIKHKFNLIRFDNMQYLNQIIFDIEFLEKLFKIENIENEDAFTTLFKDSGFSYCETDLWKDYDGKYFPTDKYIKACLIRISFHFYYNENLRSFYAYTNFWELVNGVVIQNTEEGLKTDILPYPMPLVDIIDNDEVLFFSHWEIKKFRWTEIEWERDYLSFLIRKIKNFNWSGPNKQLLDWKKKVIEEYIIRIKEYRKMLKNSKKNKIK